jgi:hypothetical protein
MVWATCGVTSCALTQIANHKKPKNEKHRRIKMNYSTAVMLINENIRAIKCSYEPDQKDANGKTVQTYQRYMFKTLDHNIKVGDYVVVPTDTRHNLTVVRVEEVDCEVDFDSPIEIKWAIARVENGSAQKILDEEEKWIAELKKAEKRHKREEVKSKMLKFYTDGDATALPIASMGSADANLIESNSSAEDSE